MEASYHGTNNSSSPRNVQIRGDPPPSTVLLGTFSLKFKSKYLNEFSSYENTKHMKSILNFPKIFKTCILLLSENFQNLDLASFCSSVPERSFQATT